MAHSFRALFQPTSAAATAMVALALLSPSAVRAQLPAEGHLLTVGGPGPNLNTYIGASTFYNAGYTGSRAAMTIIDAGHFWGGNGGHETLAHATVRFDYLNQNSANLVPINQAELLDPGANPAQQTTELGEFDFHGTAVAHAAGGRIPTSPQQARLPWYPGIAPGADMWSGAAAIRWRSLLGFVASSNSFLYPYLTAVITGANVPDGAGGTVLRRADVVNTSFGYSDASGQTAVAAGIDIGTLAIDGIARASGKTLVFSAGNGGSAGTNTITGPATGYNSLVVGALNRTGGSAPFTTVAAFSSRGPQRYTGPDANVAGVRARVDIVAPGTSQILASYTGATGGNGSPPQANYTDPTPGVPSNYLVRDGTSFAAPVVAGGAALLADVGYDLFGGGNAVHANVIKVVLLNSAAKIAGWTNNTTSVNGVLTTTQALDFTSGAGALDLNQAFIQYTTGVTDVQGTGGGTNLAAVGWDFGTVTANGFNDYYFATTLLGTTQFSATLNWFVGRTFVGVDFDGDITATNDDFINLNLEFWQVLGGVPTNLVAISSAAYINTEHLYFTVPESGRYMLRVRWAGERFNLSGVTEQQYGLAWFGTAGPASVDSPEPGTVGLAALGLLALTLGRRRR